MSDFVRGPELLIAGIGVAALLFFALRSAAKGGRAAQKVGGSSGDGVHVPYASDSDCGGDGGGGDGGGD